jgi:hypothetical protein
MKKENLIVALLVVSIVLSAVSIFGVFGKGIVREKPETIDVSGSASAFVKPDVAYIDLGINVSKSTVKEAMYEANQKMTAIIQAVKALGVKDEDIQTSNFWVNQNYNYSKQPYEIIGYSVSNTVTVKTAPDKLNGIIVAAADKGSNNFGNVRFDLSNKDDVKNTLISKAIDSAKKKADLIAQSHGKKVKDFKTVSMDFAPASFNPYLGGASMGMGAAEYAPSIQPGQNEIQVTVYVVFEVE